MLPSYHGTFFSRTLRLLCLAILIAFVSANTGNHAHNEPEPDMEAGQGHEQLVVSKRDGDAVPEGDRELKPAADVLAPAKDEHDAPEMFPGNRVVQRRTGPDPPVGASTFKRAPDPVLLQPAGASERIVSLTDRVAMLTRRLEELNSRSGLGAQRATDTETLFANYRHQVHQERRKWAMERARLNQMIQDERDSAIGVRKELERALQDQRRAFDELLEEKRLLSRVLRDEQRQLTQLQEKIQNPNLAAWIRHRAKRAAVLLDMPETDAMTYYARLYMQPKIGKMRNRLAELERRVEKTVDHLLPAKYGAVVAVILCFALVAFPMCVSLYVMLSLTRTISIRQYVFLGNVFLSALALGFCIARVLLRQDPLQTLYEASEQVFMLLQLLVGVFFPSFMLLLAVTIYKSRRQGNAYIFVCEFVFYVMVGLNYRRRVWEPAMVGEIIHTNTTMYFVYLIDFVCMTVLTISAAKGSENIVPATFYRNSNVSYLPLVQTGSGSKSDDDEDGNHVDASEAKRTN